MVVERLSNFTRELMTCSINVLLDSGCGEELGHSYNEATASNHWLERRSRLSPAGRRRRVCIVRSERAI